jgi:hypothetical protein
MVGLVIISKNNPVPKGTDMLSILKGKDSIIHETKDTINAIPKGTYKIEHIKAETKKAIEPSTVFP